MRPELLEKLCEACGISGFEEEVAGIMEEEFRKHAAKVWRDKLGNLIAELGEGELKLMIAAHMDEIGLLVKHIEEKGFLSFVKIGGIDDKALLNQRVVIKTRGGKLVPGIIGSKPPHLQKKEEEEKVVKHDEMFIDVGTSSREEVEKLGIRVGDPICFEPNFGKLAGDLYFGKALDDRLGCYVLLRLAKELPQELGAKLYLVGTTQEEVGLKGARVSAYTINPDCAFAVDTTIAGDIPQIKERESSLKLGKGPAITLTEASGRGLISHPKMRELLIRVAEEQKIPYQLDVLEGGMTDGAIIYLTREGVPTGVVSIPCRYIHSPTGIFSLKDVENSVELLKAAVLKLAEEGFEGRPI